MFGWFEDEFKDALVEAIEFFIETLLDGAFQMMTGFMADLGGFAALVLEMTFVKNALLYIQGLAATILVVQIAYHALVTYILRANGDADANPTNLLKEAMISLFVVSMVPWIVREIYLFGSKVAGDLASVPGMEYEPAAGELEAAWDAYLATNPVNTLLFAIGLIIAIIFFVIIIVQAFIRAGELAVNAGAGALFALTIVGGDPSRFKTWWNELLSISSQQVVQIFLLKLAFGALEQPFTGDFAMDDAMTQNPFTSLLLFLGIMWVTVKVPSTVRSYVHSTGAGKVGGQAGNMLLMRKMMTKGR